eukprot:11477944-Alexandrium_andersonii.AAC.1
MVISAACDTWRRLVFRFDCFPWKLFRLLALPAPDVRDAANAWLAQVPPCCVDEAFTAPLRSSLLSPSEQPAILAFLRQVLSRLRCSSVSVEAQHLKISVKRACQGGKLSAQNASLASYVECVKTDFQAVRGEVDSSVFGTSLRRTSALLRAHQVGNRAAVKRLQ